MENTALNILVLEGGGSKGVYTIGLLKELEKALGAPLYKHFGLIYGTSTGSIIGALIALGHSMESIEQLYLALVPKIMTPKTRSGKSKVLLDETQKVFKGLTFEDFKTNIGIVAMDYETQMPIIFKTDQIQSNGDLAGYGCTIAQAVRSSCSAYPFFEKIKLKTEKLGAINVVDGGFIANNAVLYSIADASNVLGIKTSNMHLLNIGVGHYTEQTSGIFPRIIKRIGLFTFIERVLRANTNSNLMVSQLLFPNLNMVRISESFLDPIHGTFMFEADVQKLEGMLQLGRRSYLKNEQEILNLIQQNTEFINGSSPFNEELKIGS